MRLWLAGLALAALAGCGGAGEEAHAPWPNAAAGVAYVGDAACATCHEDLYAGYQSHGMAHSFYRWTSETRVEAAREEPLRHEASGFAYAVLEADGGLVQEETRTDVGGGVVHRLRRRMDFVMGSGNAARTYFFEENGRLFQLPLTWYTQAANGAGRWAFSPGYETANGRFDRLVPDRCMACHNSYPTPVPFVEGKYATLPEGIGCERCHGPGALHVEARLASDPPGGVDSTIVNPAHLPADLRLDACQQCHFQGTVDVLREGETAFSYRPGQPLAAHVAHFAAPDAGAGVAVVSHADRMQQSPCFRATQGTARALTCTTCHDPHQGFRDQGPAYFDRTCRSCHAPAALQAAMPAADLRAQHTDSAPCFSCHMPRVEAEDAPHASFTDHYTRVVRPGARPASPDRAPGPSGVLAPYFARDRDTDDGAVYEGMAAAVYGTQRNSPAVMAEGAALLANALRADSTRGEAQFLLGITAHRLGSLDFAVPALERAARLGPDVPQRLEALALAYDDAGRSARVVEQLYRRALALQPALATVRTSYGRFLQAEGRREDALAAFRAARAERPSYDLAALHAGLVLLELGRRAEAEAAFAETLQLNPAHAEVLANTVVVRGGRVERYAEEEAPAFVVPAGAGVRFAGVPARATVRVYTPSGVLLREGSGATWDLRTDAGRPLRSGQYLVHLRDGAGTRVVRVAVVRAAS